MCKICKIIISYIIIYLLSNNALGVYHDPTKPAEVDQTEISGTGLQVQAIFYNKDDISKRSVIIEGRQLKVGDKIMNAKVIMIEPHEVKLKDDNGEFVTSIPYSDIKTPINKTKKD